MRKTTPWTAVQFFAVDRTGQCAQKGRPSNRPDGLMMLNTHSEFGGRLFVASDRPAAGKGGLGCGKAGDGNAEG